MILMNCASETVHLIFICPAFTKLITVNGQEYHLQVVDTAGQVCDYISLGLISSNYTNCWCSWRTGLGSNGFSLFSVILFTHVIEMRRLQWLWGWSCTCCPPLPCCLSPFLSPIPFFPGLPLLSMNICRPAVLEHVEEHCPFVQSSIRTMLL